MLACPAMATEEGIGCLGALAAVVAGVVVLYAVDWQFTGNQFTAYSIECAHAVVDNECRQPKGAEYASTYKIYTEQQFVVHDGLVPTRYSKCSIFSRTSWSCSFDDDSGSFGVRDGTFWEIVPSDSAVKPLLDHRYYVPRWRFLAAKYGLKP